MWLTSLLVEETQVTDAECLEGCALSIASAPILPPRAILAHVLAGEDPDSRDAYRALTCYALRLNRSTHSGVIDLLHPTLDLTTSEQAALRTWLICRRWPAWARADHTVRKLLGAIDPPIALAEAARHWMIPPSTLAKAALEERLPTIRAGDRQLVYLATITEAQDRGLLHARPGRPRRGR